MWRMALRGVIGLSLLGMVAPAALGDIAELRQRIGTHGELQHLYSFEGDTVPDRQQDQQGSVDLAINTAGTGDGSQIAYVTGFDGQSTAMQPQRIDALNGAGLRSSANVSWSDTLTVEALFRVDGTSGNQYIVSGPGTLEGGRGYFLYTQSGVLRYAISNTGGLNDASTTIGSVTHGHWYYVASTFSKDGGGNVTINSYLANLSQHQTSLTHAVVNDTRTSPYGASSRVGVGMFSGGPQEFFDGQVDEVAIYNGTLSQTQLQNHLDGFYTFTAGNLVENFDTATEHGLHPGLQDAAGSYRYTTDEALNIGSRSFVRTRATNFNEVDFTAEVTVTINDTAGPNIAFFGIGGGEPDATEFRNPIPALYFETHNLRIEVDSGANSNDAAVQFFTNVGGLGTHRLQITKLGDDVTFSVDLNFAGGVFTADESHTVSLAALAPFLDATNSRIFFGSETHTSPTTFDDLVITVAAIPEPVAAVMWLLAAAAGAARRGR